MQTAALLILLVFTVIASVDGFYFHLYKYRLWERPGSRHEHLLHTVNACLFPVSLAPLFLAETTGVWLWFALALNVATLVVESMDVFEERRSRESLGGLTSSEYWMHFSMSGLRWGYVVAVLAALPEGSFSAPSRWAWRLPAGPTDLLPAAAWGVTLMGLPVAIMHVVLAMRGARSGAGSATATA